MTRKHGGAVGRKWLLQIHTRTRSKESLLQAKIGLDNGVHFSAFTGGWLFHIFGAPGVSGLNIYRGGYRLSGNAGQC